MYNGIEKIKSVIDYIEANITAELDYSAMAAAILDMMASKRIMTDEFILMTHKKIKRKR